MVIDTNFQNVMLGIFTLGILAIAFPYITKSFTEGLTEYEASTIPNILVSIGIFGTFFGIFLGLWKFNPNDIKGSVPPLLDGLRLAFVTSIWGLFLSLLLKWRHIRTQAYYSSETGDNDYEALLQSIHSHIRTIRNILNEQTHLLKKGTSGDQQEEKVERLEKAITDLGQSFSTISADLSRLVQSAQGSSESSSITENANRLLSDLRTNLRDFSTDYFSISNRNHNELKDLLARLIESVSNQERSTEIYLSEGLQRDFNHLIEIHDAILTNSKAQVDLTRDFLEWPEQFENSIRNLRDLITQLDRIAMDADSTDRLLSDMNTLIAQNERICRNLERLNPS